MSQRNLSAAAELRYLVHGTRNTDASETEWSSDLAYDTWNTDASETEWSSHLRSAGRTAGHVECRHNMADKMMKFVQIISENSVKNIEQLYRK